ncbi:MAG: methyltransferase [Clostridia bacterium]|nr:methyltransferase [Clostridia bacterium]
MKVELLEGENVEELGIDRLKIIQSDKLYRFTSDAVLLTKFAAAKKGEKLADFCSGSGIVGLHFYALNKNLIKEAHLFELQPALANMSERSVLLNDLGGIFSVHNTPIAEIGAEFNNYFSLILCNPPYEKAGAGEENLSESVRIARREVFTTLEEIVKVAAKKLKFGGRFCISHRADRLVDVVCAMRDCGIEPKRVKFACGKNKAPYLLFAEGVKGGKPSLGIEPSIIN